jgi:hypothetical protein
VLLLFLFIFYFFYKYLIEFSVLFTVTADGDKGGAGLPESLQQAVNAVAHASDHHHSQPV